MNDAPVSSQWKVGKGLLVFSAFTYGILPAIIDTQDPHHLGNPDWTPHSKLHLMWLVAMGLYLSLFSIYLFIKATPKDWHLIKTGVIIGACQVGGFYTAGLFKNAAGAAFDADGRVLFGFIPPAMLHFIISGILLASGYLLTRKAVQSVLHR